jgi:hypothetical protein
MRQNNKKPKLNLKEGFLMEDLKEFLHQHEYSSSINFNDFPNNVDKLSSLIFTNKYFFEYIQDWFENHINIKIVNSGNLKVIDFLSLETNKNIEKLYTGNNLKSMRNYLMQSIPKNNTIEYMEFLTFDHNYPSMYFNSKSKFLKCLIEESKSIKEFNFGKISLDYHKMKDIHLSLKQNKTILKLDLSERSFMTPFSEVNQTPNFDLPKDSRFLSIKNSLERGSRFLYEILIGNSTIQELYLNKCEMESIDLKNLVDGLNNNSSIKILHLWSNYLSVGDHVSSLLGKSFGK